MKKKVLLLSATIALAFSATAQVEAGRVFMTGGSNLGFSAMSSKTNTVITSPITQDTTVDGDKTSNFDFSVGAGYVIMDGLVGGLMIDFSSTSMKPADGDTSYTKNANSMMTAGPFVRYYFMTEGFAPYLGAQVGFGMMKSKYEPYTGTAWESDASVMTWSVGGGGTYFANDHIGIDIGISYGAMTTKTEQTTANDGYDGETKTTSSGIGFNVGIVGVF